MLVAIVAFATWWVLGWKLAVALLLGGLVQALGHVCAQPDQAHVRTILDEQRKREGFLRHG